MAKSDINNSIIVVYLNSLPNNSFLFEINTYSDAIKPINDTNITVY